MHFVAKRFKVAKLFFSFLFPQNLLLSDSSDSSDSEEDQPINKWELKQMLKVHKLKKQYTKQFNTDPEVSFSTLKLEWVFVLCHFVHPVSSSCLMLLQAKFVWTIVIMWHLFLYVVCYVMWNLFKKCFFFAHSIVRTGFYKTWIRWF